MNCESIDLDSIDDVPQRNTGTGIRQHMNSVPPSAPKKVEYIRKKKAGSMDELDIELEDEPVVKTSEQTVEAMDISNCQEPTQVMETSNCEPVYLNSPTAPFIELSNGDLAPQPPLSPRSQLPRYNPEHWSKKHITPIIDPAPLVDNKTAVTAQAVVPVSQNCSSQEKQEIHKGHPLLEGDDSFEVEAC